MNRIFSMGFWVQLFMSTMLTLLMIYLIKNTIGKANIPVVSGIVNEA